MRKGPAVGGRGYGAGMDLEDAEVGKRYRAEIKDCCVAGSFEAVLVAKNYVPNSPADPEPFFDGATFSNGVTIDGAAVVLIEVPVPA